MSAKSEPRLSLGLDLGTQSIKALVLDTKSKTVVHVDHRSLDLYQDDSGRAEQNASDWLTACIDLIANVPETIKASIAAVSVSGQQHGFVPVSDQGTALAPVKLWCDTSTQSQCDEIMNAVGGRQQCIDVVGNPILVGYTASKILHFKQTEADAYKQMRWVMLPHDYLNYWLTGEAKMEMGDASGTGLLDIRLRQWSKAMIDAVDDSGHLQRCLPPLLSSEESIGELRQEIASALGLTPGIPIAVGGGDNMMAAVGTGAVGNGKLTLSLGTSGTLFAYADKPMVDPNGEIAAFCSSNGGWLPLLCTMACTATTELYRSLLATPLETFDATLSLSQIGAEGLQSFPYSNGERVPNLPNGRGALLGISASNLTPANVLRSAVEGICFGMYYGLQKLTELGLNAKEIVITGGGSNSAAWRQIVADIFGLPVRLLANDQGAAHGAAIQAAALLENQGRVDIEYVESFLNLDDSQLIQPDPSNHQTYQQLYTEYLNSQAAVISLYS